MKFTIPILILIFSTYAHANDKFWISNKIEMGYNKVYVSEQVTFKGGEFIKNSLSSGLRFEITKQAMLKTFYLLEHAAKNNWKNDHFVGAKFQFKLQ